MTLTGAKSSSAANKLLLITALSSTKKTLTVDITHRLWSRRKSRLCILEIFHRCTGKASLVNQATTKGASMEIEPTACTTRTKPCVGEASSAKPVLSDKGEVRPACLEVAHCALRVAGFAPAALCDR
jgi:hypothetical protein